MIYFCRNKNNTWNNELVRPRLWYFAPRRSSRRDRVGIDIYALLLSCRKRGAEVQGEQTESRDGHARSVRVGNRLRNCVLREPPLSGGIRRKLSTGYHCCSSFPSPPPPLFEVSIPTVLSPNGTLSEREKAEFRGCRRLRDSFPPFAIIRNRFVLLLSETKGHPYLSYGRQLH